MSKGHASDAVGATDAANNGTVTPPRLRRYLAGLMALVILATSFTLALREPALAISADVASAHVLSAGNSNTAALSSHRQERPTPCQKSVLPGTASPCPLANFSFNSIAVGAADIAMTASITAAPWRLSNSSRPPQCLGFSPYRPPCAAA